MNTASSIPPTNGPGDAENGLIFPSGMSNGFSHDSAGWMASGPASPPYTLINATTENTTNVRISAPSSPTWVRADNSIPITQITVITAIQITPTTVTAKVDGSAPLSKSLKV